MKIDGKVIAQQILDDLKNRVDVLKNRGITPHLVIILIGSDPASETYVKQKVLKGESIGIKLTLVNLESRIQNSELLGRINKLNNDSTVHGIIVQRPLPDHIDEKVIDEAVLPNKDVDGFHPNTPFTTPLPAAVLKILEYIYSSSDERSDESRSLALDTSISPQLADARSNNKFIDWLKTKTIVVVGKGKTGGGPVLSALVKLGVEPLMIDSKTHAPKALNKNADIIICAVGRPNMLTKDMIKKGVILIAVGMYKGEDGKMHGDYDEEEIKDIAGYYTPVPGGVGPVNVAMLLQNAVKAAENVAG